MKIFRMLKRFKSLESIESAIANAQTELNKTLTQSASVKDEYERKTNELDSELYHEKNTRRINFNVARNGTKNMETVQIHQQNQWFNLYRNNLTLFGRTVAKRKWI